MSEQMLKEQIDRNRVLIEQLDMKLSEIALNSLATPLGVCHILKDILIDKGIITSEESEKYFSPDNIDGHVLNTVQFLASQIPMQKEETVNEIFNEAKDIQNEINSN